MPAKTIRVSMQYRDAEIVREKINKEARTVELSFSSEFPVERWFGYEILDHSQKSVRLKRAKVGLPFLVNHSRSDQVGITESVEIDSQAKKGRAVVRFGKSARAEEIFNDIVDGIRNSISCGYQIYKMVLEKEEKNTATYRATDWDLLEISTTPIPADTTIGVGRQEGEVSELEVSIEDNQRGGNTMSENPKEVVSTREQPAAAAVVVDVQKERGEARQQEQKRVKDILSLGEQHKCQELARKFVDDGKEVSEFREEILKTVYKAKEVDAGARTAEIGMSPKEIKRFSLVRAMHALANPADRSAQQAAGFEFDCSGEQAKVLHKQPRGLFIPRDVTLASLAGRDAEGANFMERMMQFLMQRDLAKGTGSAGGYTVSTDLLSQNFIKLLRNRMMVKRMGATILGGLVGDVAIPKQTGGATAYWITEGNAPTESQQTLGQVGLTPKTCGAFTDISRKLLLQSSIDVEAFVRADLAAVLALAIDYAAIYGQGADNEPEGILRMTGIGSVAGGTNGLAPTWAHIVALETALAAVNADVGSMGYLTNAKARGKLKVTEKATNTAQFIWGDMMGEPGMGSLNGYRAGVSNQVPSTLVKGSSGAVCSAIIFGNWADLIIAEWGAIDVLIDPYTGGAAGTVRARILQDVDVALRHPASMAAMQDALTT